MKSLGTVVLQCQQCGSDYTARCADVNHGRCCRFCSPACVAASRVGSKQPSNWEIDWGHPQSTGTSVMARNTKHRLPRCREWRLVNSGSLRRAGINTPTYRKDSWEVDWSKRDKKRVWARNPASKMPEARKWHWVQFHTLDLAGVKWQPIREKRGRWINFNGYVTLSRRAMTEEEINLAEQHGIFKGKKKSYLWEHQLVALQKYGCLSKGSVVRHLNGVKTDNRPENLVRGTTQENTMDHNTARLQAMLWREKYEAAAKEIEELKKRLGE